MTRGLDHKRLLCVAAGAVLSFLTTLEAATLTVTNTNDSGPGSLREAVSIASSGDLIQFDPALDGVTITLTSGEILIDKDATIEGLGKLKTVLDGNHSSRIFEIGPGANVKITDLTVQNGWARECLPTFQTRSEGGGIYNAGNLELDRVLVTRNLVDHRNAHCDEYYDSPESIRGAGVFNAGTLVLQESSLDSNAAGGYWSYGGGLYNSGTAFLTDSTADSNGGEFDRYAGVQGAGIYNDQGTVQLLRSSVSGNDIGKGIQSFGSLTITDSVIGGNGGWRGGGISGGVTLIKNSLISGNWGGVGSDCGGISASVSMLEDSTVASNRGEYAGGMNGAGIVRNSTIANNEGYWSTGGIGSIGTMISSTVVGNVTGHRFGGMDGSGSVKNSIIAGNFNFNDPDQSDCGGPVISLGHNILGDPRGCSGIVDGVNGDMAGVDWTLLVENNGAPYGWPLVEIGDNGGPTPTAALLPDSPAIDRIPPEACTDESGSPLTTDQRGVARPQGSACDVGAFEFAQPRGTGFWAHQCSDKGFTQVAPDDLQRWFSEVADTSSVFPECAPIGCDSLQPDDPRSDIRRRAQLGLLDLWLNLESGRQTRGRPIVLPQLTSATTVTEALSELEMTVCDPQATQGDLGNAVALAKALNNGGDDMELVPSQTTVGLTPGTTSTMLLGLVNMSDGNRNFSLNASGPWPVRLSTARINALGSGEVAQVFATVTAPLSSPTTVAPITITATDLLNPEVTREVMLSFRLASQGATKPPTKKPTQVE